MSEISKTFCPLPWVHLHVATNNKVQICCIGRQVGDLRQSTLEEIWNSDEMKKLRIDLLSGTRNDKCTSCYAREDMGAQSMRAGQIKSYEDLTTHALSVTDETGYMSEFNLFYIDFRFNNLCNFKCRMCVGDKSSSIAVEQKQLGIRTTPTFMFSGQNEEQLYNEVKEHYATIRKLYFAGGEPFMQWQHWQILDDLVSLNRASEMYLFYNTNGSSLEFKDKDIFKIWKNFYSVRLVFSIDATGAAAEYWRDGTIWEDVKKNITLTVNDPHVAVMIHSVVGWPNIFSWIEFIKSDFRVNLIPCKTINVQCIETPAHFSLQIVPEFKKTQIKSAINDLKVFMLHEPDSENFVSLLDYVIQFMYKADTSNLLPIQTGTSIIDAKRGKSFYDAFPEHKDMKPFFT